MNHDLLINVTAAALAGPWKAVIADDAGDTAYLSVEAAIEDLGEDHPDDVVVWVVRGSAAPTIRDGRLCMPVSYRSGDAAGEAVCYLVDPDDASLGAAWRFAQAQAMAAGLNAAAAQLTTTTEDMP